MIDPKTVYSQFEEIQVIFYKIHDEGVAMKP